MRIAKNVVVTMHYEMFDGKNKLLDKTDEAIHYLHGGYDAIFPLVEEALEGKQVGESVDLTLSVDDAFGEYDDSLVHEEDIEAFPDDIEIDVGSMFEADDPETGEVLLFRVTNIAEGKVVVDANHPFAGMPIRFVGKVVNVRAATPEEIAHEHVHGEPDSTC